jgi:hypothetical protein
MLREQLTASPLKSGEIRRIEGMGELYVSTTKEMENAHEYTFMYSLYIDEIPYYFFSKLNGDQA